MPCSKVTITKNIQCDKDNCLCIPTNGACLCVCENETGDVTSCECKCENYCKCGDKCTCVKTAGFSCICVCRDEFGKMKTCGDCSCVAQKAGVSCKGKSNTCEGCKCNNASCVCLNTCICICRDEKECFKKCGECSCVPAREAEGSCKEKTCDVKCKCANAKCVCLNTGGATCSCVCSDEKGNIKACEDCSCVTQKAGVSCKGQSHSSGRKCQCDGAKCVCLNTGGATCVCVCSDEKENSKECGDCSCLPAREAAGTSKGKTCDTKCKCANAKCICLNTGGATCICVCSDEKGNIKTCGDCSCVTQKAGISCKGQSHSGGRKSHCDGGKCVCLNTGGASCICVCSDEKENIKECGDCSCVPVREAGGTSKGNTCDIKCKCANVKCVCLNTGGANCICVCSDEKGNIKTCGDCSCVTQKAGISCKGQSHSGGRKCHCDGGKCVCLNTGGASCICVCSDEKENIKECGDCSCVPAREAGGTSKGNTCDIDQKTLSCKLESDREEEKCEKSCCKCESGNVNSCICKCKNMLKESVRCDVCKCNDENKCNGKGCCITKEFTCVQAEREPQKICRCKSV